MSVGTTSPLISDLRFIKGGPLIIGAESQTEPSVVVVEFWATWCPPCRTSIPHLTEIQHKFRDVVIIGITREKDEELVRSFVNEQGDKMDYIVAIDENDTARNALFVPSGSRGIPTAFILVNNKVVWHGHPMDSGFEPELTAALSKAS